MVINFYNTLLGYHYTGQKLDNKKSELFAKIFEFDKKLNDLDYISLCLIYKQYETYFTKNNLHFIRLKQSLLNNKNELMALAKNALLKNKIILTAFYCEELDKFLKRVDKDDLLIIENMPKDFCKKEINLPKDCIMISHKEVKISNNLVNSIKSKNCNIYSSLLKENRLLQPNQKSSLITNVKAIDVDGITEIIIKELDYTNFNTLRKRYLSKVIHHLGVPKACYGVFDDNENLIGAFGITNDYRNTILASIESPSIYLLSDFVVNSNIKYLSKLILYVVLSNEVKLLYERLINKEAKTIVTNVFCRGMSSMKYRDLFNIAERKLQNDGNYNITYFANCGKWTLKEALKLWKQKLLK